MIVNIIFIITTIALFVYSVYNFMKVFMYLKNASGEEFNNDQKHFKKLVRGAIIANAVVAVDIVVWVLIKLAFKL